MSALSKAEYAPAPLAFTLRLDEHGSWIVEGPCNCCGGIFVSREAALEFVRAERRAMDEVSRHVGYRPCADALGAQGVTSAPGVSVTVPDRARDDPPPGRTRSMARSMRHLHIGRASAR